MALDIEKELHKCMNKIIGLKNFDLTSYYYNFKRYSNNLEFFYNTICKDARDRKEVSRINYTIPASKRPKVGEVAYCYIQTGYPKEIYNSHWCLILKDAGNTMTVIPTVSIKEEANPIDTDREMIIKIKDFENPGCSKLKVCQIMTIDLMRIDIKKATYTVQTDMDYIKEKIRKILEI